MPWNDIFSGKIEVSVRGLDIHVLAKHDQTGTFDVPDVEASIADLAESITEDEEIGVGGDAAEPALLKQFLESLFARVCVNVLDSTVVVEARQGDYDLALKIAAINYSVVQAASVVDIQGIEVSLQTCDRFSGLDRSSRSTSLSSADHADLMQSTIFGKEEGRSLYMSAISSQSMYHSVIDEHDLDGHIVATCHDGLRILLQNGQLDLSMERLDVVAGRPQLQALVQCLCDFELSSSPSSEPSFEISCRLKTVTLVIDLLLSANTDQAIDSNSSLRLDLHQVSYTSTTLEVESCNLNLAKKRILSTSTKPFLALQITSRTVTLCELEISPNIKDLHNLANNIKGLLPRTHHTAAVEEHQPTTFTLTCPALALHVPYNDQTWHLTLKDITSVYTLKASSARLSFETSAIIASTENIKLICSTNSVGDITWPAIKQAQRKLDFVDYKNVFINPEKDYHSDRATVNTIKQRANGTADHIIRLSLGDVELDVSGDALTRLYSKHTAATSTPSVANRSPSASSSQLNVKSLTIRLRLPQWQYILTATHLAFFFAQNVKNVDIATADIAEVKLSVVSESTTVIVNQGLHTSFSTAERTIPMLAMRWRNSTTQCFRIGVTDLNLEYHPDMPWLVAIQEALPAGSSDSSLPDLTFAVDLTSVCISLNPYTTRSKGLLYFRKSTLLGKVGKPLNIHAGVADLFLIDNIEGCQNDSQSSSRLRNDPIAGPLIKLGFVQVASLETVEINVSTDEVVSVNISGAILTLTTCADSTQTLITLLNSLRLPVMISDELKYRLGLNDNGEIPLDIFQNIEEDAFRSAAETVVLAEQDEEFHDLDEDFLSQSVLAAPKPVQMQLQAKNCFVVWNLHDGYDWDSTRTEISMAVEAAVSKAQQPDLEDSDSTDSNEIGDLLFNSIYIALPNGARQEEVTEAINKELAQADSETASQVTARPSFQSKRHGLSIGRSKAHKARIEVSGLSLDFELISADEGEVVNRLSLDIRDFEIIDNVSTSTWRKFITQIRGEARSIGLIDIQTIRPVPGLAAAELIIKADVAPLRLHVDQDTLEFLTRFFEFKVPNPEPVLPAEDIFIQRFEVLPIKVQIDYKPKRVDFKSLRSGRTTEFKNFFILEESNMVLKHVVLYGICGLPRVFTLLNDIWLAHVKSNQLGSVLAGVSPLRSLASFGGSLKDLVMVPITEYKKDGKIVPGLQKGITSFARSTGHEAVRLGAKLAIGTQGLLESAEAMLVPQVQSTHAVSMYANQPANLRQGVSQAITGMTRNVVTARDAIAALPRDLEDPSVTAKAASVAVLRPLIGTTEMISKTLLGLRNSMNPEQRRLNDDKYK